MIPEKAYIYGLYDARIPDVIWYVGKTNNPITRLQYYRKDPSTTPVYKWFRRLQSEGSEPKLRVLEECPFNEWKDRERAAIALYRKKNLLLLNKLDGGNGTEVKGRKEFCDKCGTKRVQLYPSDSTRRCPVCRKQQRAAYEASWANTHSEQLRKYRASYYAANRLTQRSKARISRKQRIERGLCGQCESPAVPRRTMCQKHLTRARETRRNYRGET